MLNRLGSDPAQRPLPPRRFWWQAHRYRYLEPAFCFFSVGGLAEGPKGGRLRLSRRILEEKGMTIPARYENGVFRPLQDAPIKEGTVVEVHVPVEAPAKRPRSIGDSAFAGMWKDREDMADSVEYINRLRAELHG